MDVSLNAKAVHILYGVILTRDILRQFPVIWCNPNTGHIEAVPRHTEISDKLAKKIIKALSLPEI
jgi:hypothetical protein